MIRMAGYKRILASRVDRQVWNHFEFLFRVSPPAAKRFRQEFGDVLEEIGKNPFQFPWEQDLNLPEEMYRKALFAKRYKVLFMVDDHMVYIDAVVDCRQSNAI